MGNYRDKHGVPITHVIALSLPAVVWTEIDRIREAQRQPVTQPIYDANGRDTGHVRSFTNPPLALGPMMARIIRENCTRPIVWPDWEWLRTHGEATMPGGKRRQEVSLYLGPMMTRRTVDCGPHAYRLIAERAAQEGKPIAETLRRLVRQVLEV